MLVAFLGWERKGGETKKIESHEENELWIKYSRPTDRPTMAGGAQQHSKAVAIAIQNEKWGNRWRSHPPPGALTT